MRFVIRVDRMGGKVEVRGLAVGDEKIHRFERTVRHVVKASALPVRITMKADGEEDRSDLVAKLRGAFLSEQAIAGTSFPRPFDHEPRIADGGRLDILRDLKVHIIQKLIPKLQKDGYVEVAEAEATARDERRAQEAQNPDRPLPSQPRQPQPNMPYPFPSPFPDMARPRPGAPVADFPPPGFEDEYEIINPPRGGIVMPDGRSPFNIGHDDLNPPGLGPHDPLRGSFIGGGGLPRPGGSSGMHPTFDDPLFGGQGGVPGAPGGYDPQAPPGARWDPVGPGGAPGFPGPGSGRGNGQSGGGYGGYGGYGGGLGDGFI